jgi:AcrR family transcriptional regulator
VYYHFSGKDDLFAAAMRSVLDAISGVVVAARPSNGMSDGDGLRATIDAVWDWVDANPQQATLVHIQLPGATRQMTAIRQDFQELHVRRAFDYIAEPGPSRQRPPAATLGAATLTMRTLVDALMAVHAMRLEDGPLSTASPTAVRNEVHRIANALLMPR